MSSQASPVMVITDNSTLSSSDIYLRLDTDDGKKRDAACYSAALASSQLCPPLLVYLPGPGAEELNEVLYTLTHNGRR
jgi:hypothetical protein